MKLIFKYLKPHTFAVLLCLVLLFGQAVGELYLPNLMSDIVNTGIQLGGVKEGAPKVISKDGIELLQLFMTAEQKEVINDGYTFVKAGSSESKNYTDDYPNVQITDVLAINTDNSDEMSVKVDDAYNNSAYAFMIYMIEMQGKQGTSDSADIDGDSGFSDMNIKNAYSLTPLLTKMPVGSFEKYIDKAEENSTMSGQIGTTFTSLFYKELGADITSMQKNYILNIGILMLGVALVGGLASIFVGYFSARISSAIGKKMRYNVFKKVNDFSNSEFDRFSTASLITRTTNDIQQIQMLVVMGLRFLCFAPLMGLGGIIMALQKSVSLSWIIAVAVLCLLGIISILLAVALPKFKILQKLIDKLNLVSRENLSGIMVIRAFGNEQHEEKRFEKANADLRDTTRFVNRTMFSIMPIMMFIMNAVTLTVIWVGAKEIEQSTLQIGDMMAFIQYAMYIIFAFLMVSMMFVFIPRALVSATRIREVLDCELSIKDLEDCKSIGRLNGKIEYKNVYFRYNNAENDVLENISFTASPGQITAFIGSTGSGKSTLINLLPRFYDVTAGSIEIDGTDIRNMSQEELRDNIGYIPQKGVLFSGTIDSNTRYGRENADEKEVLKALEVAQALDFVSEKEDCIMSSIAQEGTNVSGGQKQRLSIARALLKKSPIYIFDDSFSALDFKTDSDLRKALKEYTGDASVLIVAQRVSTIMNAEQIIVFDNGKIVGKGTHKELLNSCPEYREIAESQLLKNEI